ncbi:divalent-cation tolerance protein CutA [Maritimibacter fusiformis]|nr:divalent-cation tolerance protein CutA [Maritimibacter fusiformis]
MQSHNAVEAQITFPSEDLALAAADRLVGAGLIACGQIARIASVYTWQGRTERAEEWLLTAKTTRACLTALEADIRAHHPDEVPQITALAIVGGSADYLDWVETTCKAPD